MFERHSPRVLRADPNRPNDAETLDAIREAADVLRRGGLVAVPTETVCGLAAHARDVDAVTRIFVAKGRPATNPLIVHVGDVASARALTTSWPAHADALAKKFWPGPLTLVAERAATVPDAVTAGGPTVALRVPAHAIARAIASLLPIAAPSANPSNAVSPTTAAHVVDALGDRVDLVIDGGTCEVGIESTVLALDPPRLLRPGAISVTDLEAILGPVTRSSHSVAPSEGRMSPGMMARHYAPRAPLLIVDDDEATVRRLVASGDRVGWLAFDPIAIDGAVALPMPSHPAGYAARLYAALHELDAANVTRIVAATVPPDVSWDAVRDRLVRASTL